MPSMTRHGTAKYLLRSGLLLALLWAAAGCSLWPWKSRDASALETVSLGQTAVHLQGNYVTAYYWSDPQGLTSIFLSDAPLETLLDGTASQAQVVHVELLWVPKPGATPLDDSATNASIRHVVLAGGQLGVYSGGGFAMPQNTIGGATLSLVVEDAVLRLDESTAGFNDLLSPARMTGKLTAKRDEQKVRQLQFAISQIVTNALGKSRTVMAR
jgi:hypothetical protein